MHIFGEPTFQTDITEFYVLALKSKKLNAKNVSVLNFGIKLLILVATLTAKRSQCDCA